MTRSVHAQVFDQVYDRVWGGRAYDWVDAQVRAQVLNQIEDQVLDQIEDQVLDQINEQVYAQLRDQIFGQ